MSGEHQAYAHSFPSFLHALGRNLYTNNGSPLKTCGDDLVGCDYEYAELAQRFNLGLILETPTWRANPDWGKK